MMHYSSSMDRLYGRMAAVLDIETHARMAVQVVKEYLLPTAQELFFDQQFTPG